VSASDRRGLAASIADTISDYRAGEIDRPSIEHVEQWIDQFDAQVQVEVLRELDHVLKGTYFGREQVAEFLGGLVTNTKLAGADPSTFWANANFLAVQANGESQAVLLDLFSEVLTDSFGFGVEESGERDGPYVYLDDVLFSGGRVGQDISEWLAGDAPSEATLHVVVIATHAFGAWKTERRLLDVAQEAGKKLDLKMWRAVCFENRLAYRNNAEVLWPASLPDDEEIKTYAAAGKFPFQARKPGGKLENQIFSSEEGRHTLEQAFLVAGARIRAACKNPSDAMRPLGFSPFGLGFGATVVTFRNCPNNCPLALWWGDPHAIAGSALAWYPLLPRKTYSQMPAFDGDFPF
jgi:hypothetical protein